MSNSIEISDITRPGDATDTPKGSIQVTINPQAARDAGAQWKVGTSALQNSGATVSGVVVGNKTVQFSAITGWTAPPDTHATILFNQTITINATYTQSQTTVPNVLGMTQEAATAAITRAGLALGIISQAPSNTVPLGQVISQDPLAGAEAAVGSAVELVLSAGQTPVSVPNVVGLTQQAATSAINDAGLVLGNVTQEPSGTVPAGQVITQNPAANAQVAPGSAVDLAVSSGSQQVSVPNVVGLTQQAAASTLSNAGLVLGTVTQAASNSVPAGQILSQNPAVGVQVAPATSVSVTVSTGPSASPILSVSPLVRNVPEEADSTTFNIDNTGSGTMMWSAGITAGADWLDITANHHGTNAGVVTVHFAVNATAAERTGTIRITANGASGSPQDVSITQAASTASGMGSLVVTLEPAEALEAGAQWTVDDSGVWYDSGATVSLTAGSHTISFKDISESGSNGCIGAATQNMPVNCLGVPITSPLDGSILSNWNNAWAGCLGQTPQEWNTPADMEVSVISDQTTTATGVYTVKAKALTARIAGGPKSDLLLLIGVPLYLLVASRRKKETTF